MIWILYVWLGVALVAFVMISIALVAIARSEGRWVTGLELSKAIIFGLAWPLLFGYLVRVLMERR